MEGWFGVFWGSRRKREEILKIFEGVLVFSKNFAWEDVCRCVTGMPFASKGL